MGDLHKVYSEQLKHHSEGHALYLKHSTREIKPCMCGFFDYDGRWNPILQLTNKKNLETDGWKPLKGFQKRLPQTGIFLTAKTAKSTSGLDVGTKVETNVSTLPVGVGGTIAYKTSSGTGAVLLVDGEATCHEAGPPAIFLDWMQQNTAKLISDHKDTTTYGVWIITKTYSVKRCALTVLTSKDSEAKVSLDFHAADVGKVSPSASWWSQNSSQAWNIYSDKDGVVVFISGIYFRPAGFKKTKFKPVLKRHDQKIWLGDDSRDPLKLAPISTPVTPSTDQGPDCFEFNPELVGFQHQDLGGESGEFQEEERPPGFYDEEDDE